MFRPLSKAFIRRSWYSVLPVLDMTSMIHLGDLHCCEGDMRLPTRVQEAMQMQVEAERKKRAAILESEGDGFF